ncbi:MAG: hypothetical protein PHO31_00935 [Candidatus Pacebacteria bacterium]|nr:hypothetical protein [Candidatus Paceibacterota bacterium]
MRVFLSPKFEEKKKDGQKKSRVRVKKVLHWGGKIGTCALIYSIMMLPVSIIAVILGAALESAGPAANLEFAVVLALAFGGLFLLEHLEDFLKIQKVRGEEKEKKKVIIKWPIALLVMGAIGAVMAAATQGVAVAILVMGLIIALRRCAEEWKEG